ncbi:MAG TPA: hypothetical protein VG275_00010 [Solirubrobacteraceae bacterium]|jgi:hypothetical protein|nr:hypothetical protein [Solirubrobacteraceae bacterium]
MTVRDETSDIGIRELDRRRNDGIDVRLLWDSRADTILIAVKDEKTENSFEVEVDAADALDAFRHPYAYA